MQTFRGTILVLMAALAATAQSLPRTTPADAGFSPARLDHITQMLRADTAKGTAPGAVLLIARHGKVAYFEAAGVIDPATKAPMTRDAIFRIFSMSKAVTSVSAMMLVEEGKLSLSDPVAKYIPSFGRVKVGVETKDADGKTKLEMTAPKRPMTIQDLLRHTSGLTYGIFGFGAVKKLYVEANPFKGDFTNEEFAERIAKLPLAFQPGTTWEYSHSTDILGRVVELISGMSLYEFEKKRILEPLGMSDTGYYVTDAAKHPRIAEPFQTERGTIIGDPRAAGKWESGGGGLVSTATDYSRFLQMLLNGGALGGKRYLSPKTIGFMTADHLGDGAMPGPLYLPGPGYGFGLGFAVRRTLGVAPLEGSAGEYNWSGIAGTHFWVDPKEDMFAIFMIQAPSQLQRYRTVIRNMVYAAMEK